MIMQSLKIYDPVLCCSTGVCGPEVDERLVHFAADLEWLRARDIISGKVQAPLRPARSSGTRLSGAARALSRF